MIRLASFGVFAAGLLAAFAVFFLARGTESDIPQIAVQPEQTTAPAPLPTPEADRLYYLRDVDFDQGEITVMLFNTGTGGPLIIRDQAALRAAAPQAYVNTTTSGGQRAGSFALLLLGAPPDETVVEVYRNDLLIASVSCVNTACGSFADSPDINHAGLQTHAVPYSRISDSFDDYQSYLDTVLAISENPDFMLLNTRPQDDFPVAQRQAWLVLTFPTIVHKIGEPFDPVNHSALVQDALDGVLPDEAEVERVTVTNLGKALVADMDNGQPVTAGGAPIPFPYADFYSVRARITGLSGLPQAALDRLTERTSVEFDVDDQFAEFVQTRLQNSCVDCFFLKVDGPFVQDVRRYDWRDESYYLDYYDLREGP